MAASTEEVPEMAAEGNALPFSEDGAEQHAVGQQADAEPGVEDADPEGGARIFNDEKLGHMCIVLSPAVRRQLMRGEPLIVGTSTASVESFFQRLISVCQVGAHMPVMFQTLGGAVTVANIKKRKAGIVTRKPVDRYPMPAAQRPARPPRKNRESYPLVSDSVLTAAANEDEAEGHLAQEEPEQPRRKKLKYNRDEIPIEAVRQYLTHQTYFPGWNANAKRNLRKRCKDFRLDPDDVMRYTGRKDVELPVIEDHAQRVNLIWEAHIVDHRRRDAMLTLMRSRYYWKGMFHDVTKVLESCKVCAIAREVRDPDPPIYTPRPAAGKEDESQVNEEIFLLTAARFDNGRVFPPALPETDPTEKYPETSEVPIGTASGMD